MFHEIKPDIRARMQWLETQDSKDRIDGSQRSQRLRQIPRDTGRFLAVLAAGAPDGDIVEIGTSGGYSTLWLVVACIESDRQVTTFEIASDKVDIARETFRLAGVTDRVNLVHGDAKEFLKQRDGIAFCFLDAEKQEYQDFYDIVVPRLITGGLLVADNVISHAEHLQSFVSGVEADVRVDSLVVPIGKGELLCRRVP
ncbi:MAG TPA: class I SAM-dependent methyltransferase [Acidobacteriota bacterium]|nr:class I SAM-dependent methyltransferase [Acidobacteriota bacterium]